jgi:hypothetical protein
MSINDLIVDEFSNKNYMGSFVVYGIINANVIDIIKDGDSKYTKFNKKRLSSFVRHLDDDFCKQFSNEYNIPI